MQLLNNTFIRKFNIEYLAKTSQFFKQIEWRDLLNIKFYMLKALHIVAKHAVGLDLGLECTTHFSCTSLLKKKNLREPAISQHVGEETPVKFLITVTSVKSSRNKP